MILDDLITFLEANTSLRTLLGGPGRVVAGHIKQGQALPCVTVEDGGGDSTKRPGYRYYQNRDQMDVVTVDVWTQQSNQHRAEICELLDELLIPGPTGGTLDDTWGWDRISRSMPWDESLRAYHAVLRYACNYGIHDA
jgi:hypothetical protein